MRNVTIGYISAAVNATLGALVLLGLIELSSAQIAGVVAAIEANTLLALYVNDRL